MVRLQFDFFICKDKLTRFFKIYLEEKEEEYDDLVLNHDGIFTPFSDKECKKNLDNRCSLNNMYFALPFSCSYIVKKFIYFCQHYW